MNSFFTVNLYTQLFTSTQQNLFFSPYSIFSVLAVLHEGARGKIQKQMDKVFHFGDLGQVFPKQIVDFEEFLSMKMPNKSYQFHLFNEIYMQKGVAVQPDYLYFLNDNYKRRIQ